MSTFQLGASHGEMDISNHSSAGLQFDHKNKVLYVQHYLEKHLRMLQVCKTLSISVFALLSNTFNLVSLCVDVLRGNHTATERVVITQTRLHQN